MKKEIKPVKIPTKPLYKELSIPSCINDKRADWVNSKEIKAVARLMSINILFS